MPDVRILRLPTNTDGRDFIIGDLHGLIHLLNRLVAEIAFNPAVDRLLSVGDIVDRGEHSHGYARQNQSEAMVGVDGW